jgi:hypothetical protein
MRVRLRCVQILREGAEQKQQAETRQAALEKDVQELRQQLGQEMVSRNEFERKYLVANEELSQLRAGLSASEEVPACHACPHQTIAAPHAPSPQAAYSHAPSPSLSHTAQHATCAERSCNTRRC